MENKIDLAVWKDTVYKLVYPGEMPIYAVDYHYDDQVMFSWPSSEFGSKEEMDALVSWLFANNVPYEDDSDFPWWRILVDKKYINFV